MTDIHLEGSPWFWKIFGGTIIGMITLLLVTIFANFRNEMSDNKHELLIQVNEIRVDLRQGRESFGEVKERVVALEQGYSKEKLHSLDQLLASLTADINVQKERIATLDNGISTNKEELKTAREEFKDLTKQVQEVREKVAALTPVVSEVKKENPTTVKKP
jgi:chromosome segregation ATPase